MKSTNPGASGHVPGAPLQLVEPGVVRDACREAGVTYRKRTLDPLTTLHVLLVQALHGNSALHDLRHKPGVRATAGAICRARARLPLAFFHAVLARLGRRWQDATVTAGAWLGHRVLYADGSGRSMPDAGPLALHCGRPPGQAPRCGFPVARLLGVVHAGTGPLLEWLNAPGSPRSRPSPPPPRPGCGPTTSSSATGRSEIAPCSRPRRGSGYRPWPA